MWFISLSNSPFLKFLNCSSNENLLENNLHNKGKYLYDLDPSILLNTSIIDTFNSGYCFLSSVNLDISYYFLSIIL